MGVPQGGVLSPILFNFYVALMPTPPTGIKLITYADDCTVAASGVDVIEVTNRLNDNLSQISQFFSQRNLHLASQKSSATLFTTWTKEVKLPLAVHINGDPIPTVNNPRILGVTFDNLLTFSHHAKDICNKVSRRNRVLRALAGTSWGKDKEILVTTYKAIGRSIINYAAPVWTSFLSNTQWNNLQTRQNTALRIAAGCYSISCPHHLHEETSMLQVKTHNELLSKQFLLVTHKLCNIIRPIRCTTSPTAQCLRLASVEI